MNGFHRGIRLRISVPAGRLFQADSDMIHFLAVINHDPAAAQGNPLLNGGPAWHEILRTSDGLVIETQPAMLPDEIPDEIPGGEDNPGGHCDCPCASCSGCTGLN